MRVTLKRVDTGSIATRERGALNAALGAVAENALSDCERYVPYETGALRESGRMSQTDGKATLEWGGDSKTSQYARRQYYDTGLRHTTAGTCSHWAEKAAAVRKTAWEGIFRKVMSGGFR